MPLPPYHASLCLCPLPELAELGAYGSGAHVAIALGLQGLVLLVLFGI